MSRTSLHSSLVSPKPPLPMVGTRLVEASVVGGTTSCLESLGTIARATIFAFDEEKGLTMNRVCVLGGNKLCLIPTPFFLEDGSRL